MKQSYIWSVPTRVFHLLLALSVLAAYLTGDEDDILNYHVAVGVLAGSLFLFRIVWGFSGVRYSSFRDFDLSPEALKEYLFNVFTPKKEYAGHNPAAGWAVIAMIGLGLASVVSGFLAYGVQEGRGPFSFLNIGLFRDMEFFEELHEVLANLLMLTVGAHVGGVLLDRLLHKSVGTMASIKSGFKNLDVPSVRLNFLQKLLGTVGLAASILAFLYVLGVPGNPLVASTNLPVDYKAEHPEFYDECIACHTLYPPFLLPKKSWEVMMADLENHFGDDASLDEDVRLSVLEYLNDNAAETSTKESAFKAMDSMNDSKKTLIAYTETPYWKKRHKSLDETMFKNPKVKKKANCKACHVNIEKGIIEDELIRLPEKVK